MSVQQNFIFAESDSYIKSLCSFWFKTRTNLKTVCMEKNISLQCVYYFKVLKIGHISRKTSSVGEILNLMSVDTSTINDTMVFLGIFIENLLEVVLSLYFLYGLLGYAVFAGCGVVLLLVPVNVLLSSRSFKLMQKIMQSKDERIKLLSEVIEGIKVMNVIQKDRSK